MHDDQDLKGMSERAPSSRIKARLIGGMSSLFFVVVTLLPVIRRLRQPTILGDDITRIVDVVKYPFREHLFLPFAEHIAPLFQLVTWVTWELIGHDVRLAPLGYSAASVLSWVLVLGLFGYWLLRETGSRTAALIAVALAAHSPLVLETAWWYSASSFLWAIAGILIAILGASFLAPRPKTALALIAAGSGLGLAGTSLGMLAGPLAITRGVLETRASRWLKLLVIAAAAGGVVTYRQVCKWGGVAVFHADPVSALPHVDLWGGLSYAFSVPGRLLWPSILGVPASTLILPLPVWFCLGAGAVALATSAALACWPRVGPNRRLILVGAAMMYSSYTLTYAARVSMVKDGRWTEPQLLYQLASRYHVVPLLGALAMVAALLASWPRIRRLDSRRGLPALVAALVGLTTMFVQWNEAARWSWMLDQPDQKVTLRAVSQVGTLARGMGISRPQLMRILDPIYRGWNGSVMHDRPYAFHLMNLAVQAPERVARPLPDDEARARLLAALTPRQRLALGTGACVPPALDHPQGPAATVAVARRVCVRALTEFEPGKFRFKDWPAFIEYEFEGMPEARYLVLPGLDADQDVTIWFGDATGAWRRGQNVRWLKSARTDASIDLDRLIHRPAGPLTRVRLQFTGPGELALEGAPRLVR